MFATILQLLGLGAVIGGAALEFGLAGALVGTGVGLVYVGLALDESVS